MKELLRTNDIVLISFASALLHEEAIEAVVLDTHTSILEGSMAAIPRRMMVEDGDYPRAKALLDQALAEVADGKDNPTQDKP